VDRVDGAPIILAHEAPFRLGTAEFRPATREVVWAGESAIVEPRVMQVLVALNRAGGSVVSKDDLLQSCWDGRIVGDDAINRVVSRLRGVAEQEAGRQFRIETITKVGYRLLSASGEALGAPAEAAAPVRQAVVRQTILFPRRPLALAASALLLLVVVAAAWMWFRPVRPPAHSMTVRLADFRLLAADLPASMRQSINAEIVAAFKVDGVIGVSTLSAPTEGGLPSYSLDGTIYRVGGSIRVITRFTNERTAAILWSDSVDYSADQVAKIPHKIAVDVGTVIRCGLSGAATHHDLLPDPVLSNYLLYCQQYWAYGGSKTLRYAKMVVAVVPDFSWGWSAVGNGYLQASRAEKDPQRAEAMRAEGRAAEDKALELDPTNSEALAHKAHMIDLRDWAGQEALFKSAIAARPLDCGCEHHGYGMKLESTGRLEAAIGQYRAATDMLALWPDSQLALANALVAAGRGEEAKPYFRAAIDLSKAPHFGLWVAVNQGIETGDYAAAMTALRSPQVQLSADSRAALLSGYETVASDDTQAKRLAIQKLLALPKHEQSNIVINLLAALGATREALQLSARKPWLFWRRTMRGVLNEPGFPAIADKLGLQTYWRTSRTKPDICQTKNEPLFCRMI
jgi:DNA-binding winged helix-turn-helix (wHTH) protein/tetratricopeptide (TPR) repeat protein